MSDYAELVERLHDEARLPAQKDWDRHEAADAIKAQQATITGQLQVIEALQAHLTKAESALKSLDNDFEQRTNDLIKAKSALAECIAHADAMASAPNQELLNVDREAFRTWRAKQ